MRAIWTGTILAASLAAVACKGSGGGGGAGTASGTGTAAAAPVGAEEVARGKQTIGTLKKELVTRLTAAIGEGGPDAAITVCNTEAPAIAARLAQDGVRLGRTTRKPRNPANAAEGWRTDALAHFEQQVQQGAPLDGAHFARRLPDGRVAYAEPLVIQPLCVACHGEAIGPDVQATLARLYPSDQATGYQVGDLRGIAWVELPSP